MMAQVPHFMLLPHIMFRILTPLTRISFSCDGRRWSLGRACASDEDRQDQWIAIPRRDNADVPRRRMPVMGSPQRDLRDVAGGNCEVMTPEGLATTQ